MVRFWRLNIRVRGGDPLSRAGWRSHRFRQLSTTSYRGDPRRPRCHALTVTRVLRMKGSRYGRGGARPSVSRSPIGHADAAPDYTSYAVETSMTWQQNFRRSLKQ
jgi:hypothetical protein